MITLPIAQSCTPDLLQYAFDLCVEIYDIPHELALICSNGLLGAYGQTITSVGISIDTG